MGKLDTQRRVKSESESSLEQANRILYSDSHKYLTKNLFLVIQLIFGNFHKSFDIFIL